jgi:hypothetical protein
MQVDSLTLKLHAPITLVTKVVYTNLVMGLSQLAADVPLAVAVELEDEEGKLLDREVFCPDDVTIVEVLTVLERFALH